MDIKTRYLTARLSVQPAIFWIWNSLFDCISCILTQAGGFLMHNRYRTQLHRTKFRACLCMTDVASRLLSRIEQLVDGGALSESSFFAVAYTKISANIDVDRSQSDRPATSRRLR